YEERVGGPHQPRQGPRRGDGSEGGEGRSPDAEEPPRRPGNGRTSRHTGGSEQEGRGRPHAEERGERGAERTHAQGSRGSSGEEAVSEVKGGGLQEAQAAQKDYEERFAKGWDEAKKQLENIAAEMKERISEAIDRLLKKIEEEVLQAAEKVLEKALKTAVASWDLKEAESATEAEATKQLKAAMQQAVEDVKAEAK